jgi:hypothetical protein
MVCVNVGSARIRSPDSSKAPSRYVKLVEVVRGKGCESFGGYGSMRAPCLRLARGVKSGLLSSV